MTWICCMDRGEASCESSSILSTSPLYGFCHLSIRHTEYLILCQFLSFVYQTHRVSYPLSVSVICLSDTQSILSFVSFCHLSIRLTEYLILCQFLSFVYQTHRVSYPLSVSVICLSDSQSILSFVSFCHLSIRLTEYLILCQFLSFVYQTHRVSYPLSVVHPLSTLWSFLFFPSAPVCI